MSRQPRTHFEGRLSHGITDDEGNTAIHLAALNGRDRATETMIQLGAEVDVRNAHGQTPLHLACSRGWLRTVKVLIREGSAYVDSEDDMGIRPISLASRNGHACVVQFLLSEMAMIDQPSFDECTPLMEAVIHGHVPVAKALLEAGAGVHLVNETGDTALHLAVTNGHAGMVALLLEYNADPMTENDDLYTPRELALCLNDSQIVRLLQDDNDLNTQLMREAASVDDIVTGMTDSCIIQEDGRGYEMPDFRNTDPVIEQLVTCPITMDVMHDPVMAMDGYSYERTAISKWLRSHGTSPVTKQYMSLECLIPNRALKYFIQERLKSE